MRSGVMALAGYGSLAGMVAVSALLATAAAGAPGFLVPANRSRLQALAARSGGRAAFVAPADFRTAAHDIAASLGIDFQQ